MASQSYVMPMFVRLAVDDVETSKRWFQVALGFDVVFDIPGAMAHMRGCRYQDVLIVKGEADSRGGPGSDPQFHLERQH